jgi:hypothetical protein
MTKKDDKKPYAVGALLPYGGAWVCDPPPFCKECDWKIEDGKCTGCGKTTDTH